jgi:hypothetical protein
MIVLQSVQFLFAYYVRRAYATMYKTRNTKKQIAQMLDSNQNLERTPEDLADD